MVIYEITAKVGSHLAGEYERFMREQHIPDVLATGAFDMAGFTFSDDGYYQVRFRARSREALENYLNEHAPRLRKDFLGRFPEGIELQRREWNPIQTWKG